MPYNKHDSETVSGIRKRNKYFKIYKKSGLETDKDYFQLAKMAIQSYIKGKEILFSTKK